MVRRHGSSAEIDLLSEEVRARGPFSEKIDDYGGAIPDRTLLPKRKEMLEEFGRRILARAKESEPAWLAMLSTHERPTLEVWSKGLARTPNLRLLPATDSDSPSLAWAEIKESL